MKKLSEVFLIFLDYGNTCEVLLATPKWEHGNVRSAEHAQVKNFAFLVYVVGFFEFISDDGL